MAEADPESELSIGGNNAQLMGLHSLRKNITIIPQTPFLFKGTIRQNIDPFGEYSDEKLWRVLEQSDLRDYIEGVILYPKSVEVKAGYRHLQRV